MLPIVICRHYQVEWLDARTCYCHQCGKQGHWTDKGFSIWIRTEYPQAKSRIMQRRQKDPRPQRVA